MCVVGQWITDRIRPVRRASRNAKMAIRAVENRRLSSIPITQPQTRWQINLNPMQNSLKHLVHNEKNGHITWITQLDEQK